MVRVYDPYEPKEHIFTEPEYEQYLKRPAFIVHRRGVDPIYLTSKEDVEQANDMYDKFDGVYHEYMDTNSGMPVKLKGEEQPGSIPNSTTTLTPISMLDLVQDKMIQITPIKCDRVRCIITVGDKLLVDYMKPIDFYPCLLYTSDAADE